MVKINGESFDIIGISIEKYLMDAGYDTKRVAVELNGDILPKSQYENTYFKVAAVYDAHEPRQGEMREISDYYIDDFESFCFKTKMKTALTIAGSDPCGGAGIQVDIKTMTINGYGKKRYSLEANKVQVVSVLYLLFII